MSRLNEDLLGFSEVPTLHGSLSFDLHLGVIELLLPLLEHVDTLVDGINGDLRLETEDALDVDLRANLVADLIGYALQQVLHLVFSLVDVT